MDKALQTQLANIEKRTGKSIDELAKLVKAMRVHETRSHPRLAQVRFEDGPRRRQHAGPRRPAVLARHGSKPPKERRRRSIGSTSVQRPASGPFTMR